MELLSNHMLDTSVTLATCFIRNITPLATMPIYTCSAFTAWTAFLSGIKLPYLNVWQVAFYHFYTFVGLAWHTQFYETILFKIVPCLKKLNTLSKRYVAAKTNLKNFAYWVHLEIMCTTKTCFKLKTLFLAWWAKLWNLYTCII